MTTAQCPGRRAVDVMITAPKTVGLGATVAVVRRELEDDHVHAVLVVDDEGRLATVVTRSDLDPRHEDSLTARDLGGLQGRVTAQATAVAELLRTLSARRLRRLAVVDEDGHLMGLVCLKRSGLGFCTDEDVGSRGSDRIR